VRERASAALPRSGTVPQQADAGACGLPHPRPLPEGEGAAGRSTFASSSSSTARSSAAATLRGAASVTPSPSAKAWLNAARLPSTAGSTTNPRACSSRSAPSFIRLPVPARFSTKQAGRRSDAASFSVPSAAQMSGALGCTGTTTRSAPRIARRASLSITGGLSTITTS